MDEGFVPLEPVSFNKLTGRISGHFHFCTVNKTTEGQRQGTSFILGKVLITVIMSKT